MKKVSMILLGLISIITSCTHTQDHARVVEDIIRYDDIVYIQINAENLSYVITADEALRSILQDDVIRYRMVGDILVITPELALWMMKTNHNNSYQ